MLAEIAGILRLELLRKLARPALHCALMRADHGINLGGFRSYRSLLRRHGAFFNRAATACKPLGIVGPWEQEVIGGAPVPFPRRSLTFPARYSHSERGCSESRAVVASRSARKVFG